MNRQMVGICSEMVALTARATALWATGSAELLAEAKAVQELINQARVNAAAHASTLTDLLMIERNVEVENVSKVMNGKLMANEEKKGRALLPDMAAAQPSSVEVCQPRS
jgi:hypothetical protein